MKYNWNDGIGSYAKKLFVKNSSKSLPKNGSPNIVSSKNVSPKVSQKSQTAGLILFSNYYKSEHRKISLILDIDGSACFEITSWNVLSDKVHTKDSKSRPFFKPVIPWKRLKRGKWGCHRTNFKSFLLAFFKPGNLSYCAQENQKRMTFLTPKTPSAFATVTNICCTLSKCDVFAHCVLATYW